MPLLSLLLSTGLQQEDLKDKKAVEVLSPFFLFRGQQEQISKLLDGMEGRWFPLNEWLLRLLYPVFQSSFVSQKGFQNIFDRLEVLIALNFCSNNLEGKDNIWSVPFGLFARSSMLEPFNRLFPHIQDLGSALDREGEESVYITHELLGKSIDEARRNMDFA